MRDVLSRRIVNLVNTWRILLSVGIHWCFSSCHYEKSVSGLIIETLFFFFWCKFFCLTSFLIFWMERYLFFLIFGWLWLIFFSMIIYLNKATLLEIKRIIKNVWIFFLFSIFWDEKWKRRTHLDFQLLCIH